MAACSRPAAPHTLPHLCCYLRNFINRQRERAWGQEIVFLPPAVAAREAAVMRERRAPDYTAGVHAVLDLE